MALATPFRPAVKADCPQIAELFAVASGGVSVYVWSLMADEFPGLSPLEIGALRYARDDIPFSYRNCTVAAPGGRLAGMMVAFPMEVRPETVDSAPAAAPPPVLRPYAELEDQGSYYICGIALYPEYRALGFGSQFLDIAREQARTFGMERLSLIAFADNVGAVRLYQRHGFRITDRRPVVRHPLIRHTGDALLMVAEA